MKKRLNTDAIANELAGSVFFPSKTVNTSSDNSDEERSTQSTATQESAERKELSPALGEPKKEVQPYVPSVRTPRTGTKRLIIRHPFELYQDQVEALRQLSVEERKEGGTGSMSRMVREAIDEYLKQKREH